MTAWDRALSVIADQQALIRDLVDVMSSPGSNDALLSAVTALGAKIDVLTRKAGTMATALDNLQTADTALKQEVVTFLADQAAKVAASSDPAMQAVADDINAQTAALAAADPGVVVPPAPASPAS
jgi:hypothetical protein